MRLAKAIRTKVRDHVNTGFTDALSAAFEERFQRELESSYNIFAMALVSRPVDEGEFTPEQAEWIKAFEAGFTAAMERLP